MGFGLAMLKTAMKKKKPVPVDVFPITSKSLLDFLSIIITLVCLGVTFVYGILHRGSENPESKVKDKISFGYKKSQKLAKMLGFLYVLFILTSTVVAVKNAYF